MKKILEFEFSIYGFKR